MERASDVYLTLDETFIKSELRVLTIYYPILSSKKLSYELVELPIDTNKKVEESLLEFMMKSTTHTIFPEGTQLLDVYTHDEVCYVDFSEAFQIEKLPEEITAELLIYSIVNSLVDLPEVDHVQFLIEGRIVDDFHGIMNLQKLMSKNYGIVSK